MYAQPGDAFSPPLGCGGMRHIINVGSDIVLSPPRVFERALGRGSLQKLFMDSRPAVRGLQGPLVSRRARQVLQPLARTAFKFDTVAMSPPLVLIAKQTGTELNATQLGEGQISLGGYCEEVRCGSALCPVAGCCDEHHQQEDITYHSTLRLILTPPASVMTGFLLLKSIASIGAIL